MDRIIPSDCDVRIKIEKDALWRRVSHFSVGDDKEYNPSNDDMYLELNSGPGEPVVIDLISQRVRIMIFPNRFVVTKLEDKDAITHGDFESRGMVMAYPQHRERR